MNDVSGSGERARWFDSSPSSVGLVFHTHTFLETAMKHLTKAGSFGRKRDTKRNERARLIQVGFDSAMDAALAQMAWALAPRSVKERNRRKAVVAKAFRTIALARAARNGR
jgi:hypothetical protein